LKNSPLKFDKAWATSSFIDLRSSRSKPAPSKFDIRLFKFSIFSGDEFSLTFSQAANISFLVTSKPSAPSELPSSGFVLSFVSFSLLLSNINLTSLGSLPVHLQFRFFPSSLALAASSSKVDQTST